MKYKLINKTTAEETLCDKVTIDGFDYYVSDEEPTLSDTLNTCYYVFSNVLYKREYSHHKGCKKVIATNNPDIGCPKVVDEVEKLAHEYFAKERFNWEQENPNGIKSPQSLIEHYNRTFTPIFRAGYNKSQETHPFSEDDMIEFYEWCDSSEEAAIFWRRNRVNLDMNGSHNKIIREKRKELLQIWKEQQPKSIWYE